MAGSSNIYVWASGESGHNVTTIVGLTEYLNSVQRKRGFLVGDKLDTGLLNRALHQISLVVAGLSQFVANNGGSITDKGGGGTTECNSVASAFADALINSIASSSSSKSLVMVGATSSSNGKAGYVPQPYIANRTQYLRGDGTWSTPPDTNTTYSTFTSSRSGLVPSGGSSSKFLRGDGVWATPPDNSVTYSVFTSSRAGLVPSGGSSSTYLRGDGRWVTISTSSSGGSSSSGGGSSTVTQKSSKKSINGSTSWTVSGLTVSKPLFILVEGTTRQPYWVDLYANSSVYGCTLTNNNNGFIRFGTNNVNSAVFIPKSSSVTFTVSDSVGDEYLYAFN